MNTLSRRIFISTCENPDEIHPLLAAFASEADENFKHYERNLLYPGKRPDRFNENEITSLNSSFTRWKYVRALMKQFFIFRGTTVRSRGRSSSPCSRDRSPYSFFIYARRDRSHDRISQFSCGLSIKPCAILLMATACFPSGTTINFRLG